jgi:perosamine synthetase
MIKARGLMESMMSNNEFIPVNQPYLKGNEKKYLMDCIESGWISSEGPYVEKFEKEFAKYIGKKHAIAVSNGTAAIDIAVAALEIGPDDEVIMPTFTIISCVLQIIRSGAKPVFVDSDINHWNMAVDQIEGKINSKTKAIMVVHIYGLPVEMNPIMQLASKYNLKVIEDAAEAHGQTYFGRKCGSFGDVSTFSFYPNKHITSGEGGMVLTDSDELADECRGLRNLCFSSKRFQHKKLGWNYRMTNMQAAIGLAQLENIEEALLKKVEMGNLYLELLKDIEQIQLPIKKTEYAHNSFWVFGLLIKDNSLTSSSIDAEKIMLKLSENKIGSRPFFYPMHLQEALCKYKIAGGSYPNSEQMSKYGFYIPSGVAITKEQINIVSDCLHKIFK